jgi:Bacterial archaeo-eukaryotic release factor family 10
MAAAVPTEAAIATAQQISEFGWHRILLAGDRRVVDGFADRLTDFARERVIGIVDVNVIWEEPAAVADRLENA